MDLRRLRYFVAVAEARSVGKAAERLRMAQPPLSVQIRKLEAEVGAPLFRRGTRGMDLTEAGQALLVRASEALALASDGIEAARAVASGKRGRLSVGYMFVLANAILPRLIPELRRSVPGVDLDFAELSASTREARVLDRSVTVALCMPAINHPEIQVARIGAQRFMLAMPTSSPLARLGSVPMARLHGRPLIALPHPDHGPASSAAPGGDADREPRGDGAFGDEPGAGGRRPRDPAGLRAARRPARHRVQAAPRCHRLPRHRGVLAAGFAEPADRNLHQMRREGRRADVTRRYGLQVISWLQGGSAPGRVQVRPAQLAAKDSARRSSSALMTFSCCRARRPCLCRANSSAA